MWRPRLLLSTLDCSTSGWRKALWGARVNFTSRGVDLCALEEGFGDGEATYEAHLAFQSAPLPNTEVRRVVLPSTSYFLVL